MNPVLVEVIARWAGRASLVLGFLVAGWLLLTDEKTASLAPGAAIGMQDARCDSTSGQGGLPPKTTTRMIEDLRVGDRVMASNPEVTDAERGSWEEPDWEQWLHLSLVMPREDGSELEIELLRPESWVLDQARYVVEERETESTSSNLLREVSQFEGKSDQSPVSASIESEWMAAFRTQTDVSLAGVPLSPLRPFYRQLAFTSALLDLASVELVGLTVEMDLAEMGAVGTAVITDVKPCPPVRSGEGQAVTATFMHPPSTAVLDVFFEGEEQPIGVTENHLFWSVDRQQFLPIGEMITGEKVQTFHGDTKRIEAKLPRPGPQVVYNLEVYGEHVYFVGEQGVLAHNSCDPNIVYRLIRNDEAPSIGIFPRKGAVLKDSDNMIESITNHIGWGTRAKVKSPLISTSRDLGYLKKFQTRDGGTIVAIDLRKVNARVYDVSTAAGRLKYIKQGSSWWRPNRNAQSASEVLLDGYVLPDAIVNPNVL